MINLLPNELKEDYEYGRKNNQILRWLVTVIFGIIILVLIAAVGRLTIQAARNQTEVQKQTIETQLKNADFESVDSEYTAFSEGLGNVKKLYQQQILYTRLIRKFGTLLPPGAKITNISIGDKDRAISLNFDNVVDGLGPTIQLNLTDQSKQVTEKTRKVFDSSLQLKLGGPYDLVGGSKIAQIQTDPTKKTISFFVNAETDAKEKQLQNIVKNSGEMAVAVANESLRQNGMLADYSSIASTGLKFEGSQNSPQPPQIRSYTVDVNSKAVDFVVRADSLAEARTIEPILSTAPNSMFIETYVFEDKEYLHKSDCKDLYLKDATCKVECGASKCVDGAGSCVSTYSNGCQYIVRAYYDELYKTAAIKKVDEATKKSCTNDSSRKLPCTHSLEATYSQMFSKVDINRVASCTQDPTTGISNCPVEMRAEFSPDAKFYLINPTGVTP